MSPINPHSKRLRKRSSISASSFGGRSLAITICFMDSCSALKVWKNSSCVRSFCARNWMSSTKSTSTSELVAKAGHLVVTQRVDHLVGELFTGDVTDGRLWLTPPDLVPNGLHQVGLAHSDAAIQEERVVGLGGTLCHSLACRVRELIAAADHEGIKRVPRIQLCCPIPIEPSLGRVSGCGNRNWSGKPAIVTHRRRRGVILRSYELHVLILQAKIIDGLLDQVGVPVTDMAEFHRRHAHE